MEENVTSLPSWPQSLVSPDEIAWGKNETKPGSESVTLRVELFLTARKTGFG